jgi:hypothetical protein
MVDDRPLLAARRAEAIGTARRAAIFLEALGLSCGPNVIS